MDNDKFIRMTTAPVEKLVCELALPSIAIMLVSSLYNMADTFFVGTLGTSATAAVGVSFSLMAIIQAVGFFFGHGAGNYISRALGAQDTQDAEKMAATGFVSAFLVGTLIAVAGSLTLTPLAKLLGATETILPYARDYLRFILIGAPFMASSLMLNNLLRFQGSAFFGMIGMVGGAVLNIALDPLFIFTLNMGVSGAALATMLSQALSCGLLFLGCTRAGNVRIRFRSFSPSRRAFSEIARGGAPSLFRQGIASIATICLNQVAGPYGDAVIAAISIVNRVAMFASSALLGFGQGFQPVCGFNYGAKLYERVKKAFWFCNWLISSLLVVLAILGFIFAPDIITLFRKDDLDVIRIGALALRLQCVTFPLWGYCILNNMMLQTMGKAFGASVLALARQGLFLIPLLLILPPHLDVLGIQLTLPITDILSLLITIPLSVHTMRALSAPPDGDRLNP